MISRAATEKVTFQQSAGVGPGWRRASQAEGAAGARPSGAGGGGGRSGGGLRGRGERQEAGGQDRVVLWGSAAEGPRALGRGPETSHRTLGAPAAGPCGHATSRARPGGLRGEQAAWQGLQSASAAGMGRAGSDPGSPVSEPGKFEDKNWNEIPGVLVDCRVHALGPYRES